MELCLSLGQIYSSASVLSLIITQWCAPMLLDIICSTTLPDFKTRGFGIACVHKNHISKGDDFVCSLTLAGTSLQSLHLSSCWGPAITSRLENCDTFSSFISHVDKEQPEMFAVKTRQHAQDCSCKSLPACHAIRT